jgi:hypothetical protein
MTTQEAREVIKAGTYSGEVLLHWMDRAGRAERELENRLAEHALWIARSEDLEAAAQRKKFAAYGAQS